MKFLIAFILLATFGAPAWGAEVKINPSVKKQLELKGQANVIFFFDKNADLSGAQLIVDRTQRIQYVYDQLRKLAIKTQGPLISALKKERLTFRSFHLVNAVAVQDVTQKQLNQLVQNPSINAIVSKVEIDAQARLKLPEDNQPLPDVLQKPMGAAEIPENLKQIGVDRVWATGQMGAGIVIAGQDTGYKWDHPALRKQYRGTHDLNVNHDYNWHDAIHSRIGSPSRCGYNTAAPCDDSGHGTHTMGTMVGYDWQTQTNPIGVAPQAQWIACRNMENGVGRASTYIECFEFFLAPYPRGGNPKTDGNPLYSPHIINNSWGCPTSEGCSGEEFLQVIDALHAAGILVVASAGNEGPSCGSVGTAPGFYSGKIFSVAAYDHRNNQITSFSSRGPSRWNNGLGPNITAPGNGIRSSVPSGGLGDGLYDYKSGTSMAGPHVAGVVALLWAARPELVGQIAETFRVIESSATAKTSSQSCGPYPGSVVPNAVFGYGLVNALRAIQGQ